MMAILFAVLTASLVTGWFGPRRLAISLLAVAFLGSVALFLWEIYSPQTGFRMPWIDL